MKTAADPIDRAARKFLEETLGSTDFQVIPLAGDASSRRYARVIRDDTSHVLMMWEPFLDDGQYPFLNIQSHFEKHNVAVPQVIAKAPRLGLILLEDLGDLTLERKFWENQNQTPALPFYKQAIDELIKIHYPASQDRSSSCVAFQISFDAEKLLWEMNYGREHFIEKLCKTTLTPIEQTALNEIFSNICSTLDKEEKLICHRDFHSRNIMITQGQARVIDFQDARMGAIQYDLVSLLHDAYVDLNEPSRNEILEYYLSRAQEYRATPIPLEHFYSVFKLQAIQRCFKACGSFASFYNMREDTRYLKYLKPTITKVSELLEPYPAYSAFLQILNDRNMLEYDYLNPTEMVSQ